MREKIARFILAFSILTMALSSVFLYLKIKPFHTLFYLFIWWSYIGIADSWLYIKGGESLFHEKPVEFLTFLVPFSAVLWFIFEAFNLRITNWYYVGVPNQMWIRWAGDFFAFGTVLPGIFLTANLLNHYGILRRNEFSQFFSDGLPKPVKLWAIAGGVAMFVLPLIFPKYFFPLAWGTFVLILDPINAQWNGKSLIQEWRQKNWSRTLQLLTAGFICGGLWEFWNFWSGAKWIYSVPLPEYLMSKLKIFEMPALGFLGFPPFALECFVMTEFVRNVRERISKPLWNILILCAFLFILFMCKMIDIHTIRSFRGGF